MTEPSKLQRLKETLAARGLSPQKMFGQNFMVDTNFAAAIARDAKLDEHTLAIEVGPGTGLLTEALLASHPKARVLAIEIDRGLAELLRETLAAPMAEGRLTLLEGDALDGKHRLSPALAVAIKDISAREARPRRVLISNLPYNAGTSILANAAVDTDDTHISEALVTVQMELAQRMLAKPDTDDYGALSVLMGLRAEGTITRAAGAEVFWPRPTVESAVLRLNFLSFDNPKSLSKAEAPAFQAFLQKIFSQRRKTLRATLKPQVVPEPFGGLRAESLAPEKLLELFRKLGDQK